MNRTTPHITFSRAEDSRESLLFLGSRLCAHQLSHRFIPLLFDGDRHQNKKNNIKA
jgi:hypothetical protein